MVDFKKTPMTKEQADCVRFLRVKRCYTWSALAGIMSVKYPELDIKVHPAILCPNREYPDGHQSEGIDLCSGAAEFFGENAGDEPWN